MLPCEAIGTKTDEAADPSVLGVVQMTVTTVSRYLQYREDQPHQFWYLLPDKRGILVQLNTKSGSETDWKFKVL